MPLLQYRDQVFLTNMRVPLRCGNGCMSEEFLYHTNIDAVLKEAVLPPYGTTCDRPLAIGQKHGLGRTSKKMLRR